MRDFYILFRGGDIATGSARGIMPDTKEIVAIVSFQPLKELGEIGDTIVDREYSGDKIILSFTNPDSIDVVINRLARAKTLLLNAQSEKDPK